jgi:hypothetical protein
VNDDVEELFERGMPRGPAPELRTRVLAAVGRQLDRRNDLRRLCLAALAAAAALMVSVGLNVWADRSIDVRLARVVGPAPMDRAAMELANDIAAVTDTETGRWFYRRMVSIRKPQDGFRQWQAGCQRILNELILLGKDRTYEETAPVDRDRRGGDRRDTSWDQRLFRGEDGCPA